ncbi:uncharacterized protein LOC119662508 [Teleopsis dalmanni]|uniref:uncharacterized protein LOC119662508 n=1 Tax=Teleopsis dalmanni TaxID=139649 RepID=UPI0018CCAA18|nr:uncharacterized protein LOC119662508 [Teleopsis dalmanni]XP_037928069.1 uncharacterized protein LOC119662508 [Teleopsis dalmanni]
MDESESTSSTDTAAPPPSTNNLLDKVVAFVDVRTDNINMSSSVKSHLKTHGAKIARSITPKITHLVFKDGNFNNYTKAKNLNKPIVSLAWIEESKKIGKIADPSEFNINNKYIYDHPELFEKMKRVRRYTGGSKKNDPQKRALDKISTSTPKSVRTSNGPAFSEVNSEGELLRGQEDPESKRPFEHSDIGATDNSTIYFTPQSSEIKNTSSNTTDDDDDIYMSCIESLIDNSSPTFNKEFQAPIILDSGINCEPEDGPSGSIDQARNMSIKKIYKKGEGSLP